MSSGLIVPRLFDAESFPFRLAFTTRLGGVSRPPYDLLNLAFHVGDDPEVVLANRRVALGRMKSDIDRLTTCRQVHGGLVKTVNPDYAGRGAISPLREADADALVTLLPDTPVMILTADCVPVLLVDTATGAVGAAHAGRKGLIAGVLENTVAQLVGDCGSSPGDIIAFIGPCIRACCYEVDESTRAEFAAVFPSMAGSRFLDLAGAAKEALVSAGLDAANVSDVDLCTHCYPDLFFSYRRNEVTGRQGAIAARPQSGQSNRTIEQ